MHLLLKRDVCWTMSNDLRPYSYPARDCRKYIDVINYVTLDDVQQRSNLRGKLQKCRMGITISKILICGGISLDLRSKNPRFTAPTDIHP